MKKTVCKRWLALMLMILLGVQGMAPEQVLAGNRGEYEYDEEDPEAPYSWSDRVDLLDLGVCQEMEQEELLEEGDVASPSQASPSQAAVSLRAAAALPQKATPSVPVKGSPSQADPDVSGAPASPFEVLELRTGDSMDHTEAEIENGVMSLSFYFELSDLWLTEYGNYCLSTLGKDNLTDAEWNSVSDDLLPAISFSCEVQMEDGGSGGKFSSAANLSGELKLRQVGKIGQYTVKVIDGGEAVRITCVLDKMVYSLTEVSAFQSLNLNLNGDDVNGKYPVLSPGENGRILLKLVDNPDDPNNLNGNYDLTKECTDDTDPGAIRFRIVAEAKDADLGTLEGLQIVDLLPNNLELKEAKAYVTYAGDDAEEQEPAAVYPDVASESEGRKDSLAFAWEGGKLTLEITESAKIVRVEVTAALSGDDYAQYVRTNTPWSAKNQAKLQYSAPGPNGQLTTIKTVSAEAKEENAFFQKEGTRGDIGGKTWNWTIQMNPHFTTAKEVYLVDRLNGTVHNYEGDVNVEQSGRSEAVTPQVLAGEQSAEYSYKAIAGREGSKTAAALFEHSGENSALIYTCGEDRILLLKLDQYMSGPMTVTYGTKLLSEVISGGKTADVSNTARVVWDTVSYGPGVLESDNTIELSKKETADFQVISKKFRSYDETTQTLTWWIDVNRNSSRLEPGFAVEDGFPTAGQQVTERDIDMAVLSSQDQEQGDYQTFGGGKWDGIAGLTMDSASDPGHTVVRIKFDQPIEADQHYRIRIRAKVIDPGLLTGTSAVRTIANTASASNADRPEDGSYRSGAQSGEIKNTWITKRVVGGYDYADHALTWEITVNPNHIPLKGITLNDIVRDIDNVNPVGAYEVQSVAVSSAETPGLWTELGAADPGDFLGTVDGEQIEAKFSATGENALAGSLTAGGGDSGQPSDLAYRITLKTVLSPDYRNTRLIRKITAGGTNVQVELKNTVGMQATYVPPEHSGAAQTSFEASAWASLNPGVKAVSKSGIYQSYTKTEDGLARINWDMYINCDAADLTGFTVTDRIPETFILDQDSVKVYEAALDAAGNITAMGVIDQPKGLILEDNRIQYTIPAEYGSKPLIFKYSVLLGVKDSGDVKAQDMVNEAAVSRDGDDWSRESFKANDAKDFKYSDFITGTKAVRIKVIKGSVNSRTAGSEPGGTDISRFQRPLKNAEFTMTWSENGVGKQQVKTTGSDGCCYFVSIKEGVIYTIAETGAPDGYEMDGQPWYVYFKKKDAKDPEELKDLPQDRLLVGSGGVSVTAAAKNTPQLNLAFVKQTQDGHPLAGVRFTLTDTLGQLEDFTAVSAADGSVTFNGVDDGTYRLAEDENTVPAGYTAIPVGAVAVKVDHGDAAEPVILEETGAAGYVKVEAGKFSLINYLEGEGSVISGLRTNEAGEPLAGALIGLFPEGTVEFATENLYLGFKVMTGPKGQFSFRVPQGTYVLAELQAPDGYERNRSDVYTVTAVSGDSGVSTGTLPDGTVQELVIKSAKVSGGSEPGGNDPGGNEPGGNDPGGNEPGGNEPGGNDPGGAPGGDGGTGGGSGHGSGGNSDSNSHPAQGPADTAPPTGDPQVAEPGRKPVLPVLPVSPSGSGVKVTPVMPDTNECLSEGTVVIVSDLAERELTRVRADREGSVQLSQGPGDYVLTAIDEQETPLASWLVTIEDGETPRTGLPKTGEERATAGMVWLMLISAAGIFLLRTGRKE